MGRMMDRGAVFALRPAGAEPGGGAAAALRRRCGGAASGAQQSTCVESSTGNSYVFVYMLCVMVGKSQTRHGLFSRCVVPAA